MLAGFTSSKGSEGKSVPCLSPSFGHTVGHLRCPRVVNASPRSLPSSFLGVLLVCVSVSKFLLFIRIVCAHTQSCPTLCNPLDCSPPGSSVHEILQPRILEWVAMLSSRGSFQPRGRTPISCVSGIAGGFFSAEPLAKHLVCNKCSVNICRMN